ncbi:hypothetical protein NX775_23905, partial [Massilia aurea]
ISERLREQGLIADVKAVFSASTVAALADVVELRTHETNVCYVPPNLIPEELGQPLHLENPEEFRL